MKTETSPGGPVERIVSWLREDGFSASQRELCDTMSDISEECYCAGWMSGLEYALWGALQTSDLIYGMSEIDAEQLQRCGQLAQELGGWIVWVDDHDLPGTSWQEWGKRFVPMDEWLEMYRRHVQTANTTP